jgi:hypothetical protein
LARFVQHTAPPWTELLLLVLNALVAGREEFCCFAELTYVANDAPSRRKAGTPASAALSLVQAIRGVSWLRRPRTLLAFRSIAIRRR